MLTQAFDRLGPALRARYEQFLQRELAEYLNLGESYEREVTTYALPGCNVPGPILTYFGYHARADEVTFDDVDRIGDGLLISQLLREYLAIHGCLDIGDEDLERLGRPPLPVVLAPPSDRTPEPTEDDHQLALSYGSFLLAAALRLSREAELPAPRAKSPNLVFDTLFMSDAGRVATMMAAKPLDQITVADLLTAYECRSAHYCYRFPFEVGVGLAQHSPEIVSAVQPVLLRIGAVSQLIDDLARAFLSGVDYDTDAFGELAYLRRTALAVLLAPHDLPGGARAQLLAEKPRLSRADAERIRAELWDSPLPALALRLCEQLLSDFRPRTTGLPLGSAASEYLDDLIQHRLEGSATRLRTVLRNAGRAGLLWSPANGSGLG